MKDCNYCTMLIPLILTISLVPYARGILSRGTGGGEETATHRTSWRYPDDDVVVASNSDTSDVVFELQSLRQAEYDVFGSHLATSAPYLAASGQNPSTSGLRFDDEAIGNRMLRHVTSGDDLAPFSARLYAETCLLGSAASNVVISPISVATALGMSWEGARGNTALEIERALGLGDPGRWFKGVLATLNRKAAHTSILMANRAFLQDGFKLLQGYRTAIKTNFGSEANLVNFMNQRLSTSVVNDWVKMATKGHVTQAVTQDDIDELTQFILVNVVYFKGDWLTRFDSAHTRVSNFYVTPRDFVRVPMMKVFAQFQHNYFQELGFQMLEMPYADGGDVSMFVILPDDPDLFPRVQAVVVNEPSILFRPELYLTPANLTLSFPKFSLGSGSIPMKPALQRMEVQEMFMDGRADFSGITNNGAIAVGNIYHQVMLDFDETGATASAATAMVYRGRSALGADAAFNANKPFLFFIRDNKSRTILFMGHVRNPVAPPSA